MKYDILIYQDDKGTLVLRDESQDIISLGQHSKTSSVVMSIELSSVPELIMKLHAIYINKMLEKFR